jgi:hypothetical protein
MIARLVKIEACIGGTGSVHSRKIQGVRSFTLYLSISTSFSLLCDYGLEDWIGPCYWKVRCKKL